MSSLAEILISLLVAGVLRPDAIGRMFASTPALRAPLTDAAVRRYRAARVAP